MRLFPRQGFPCRQPVVLLLSSLVIVLIGVASARGGEDKKPTLELRPGDHICIIGNTLADRMQHDGWLETFFYTRFPAQNLVFRNLGYAADELVQRMRSQDFGSPDQWLAGSAPIPQPTKLNKNAPVRANRFELTNTKADVILAFFGYNESFGDAAGLPKFKKDLESFIEHTLQQKYNGKSAPRLVLFSPIAHENLNDRNLPDGSANNKRLELYTATMAEVARAKNVPFVDLFHPTRELYAKATTPLTTNGIHLNEHGNHLLAEVIDRALFPNGASPQRDTERLEKVRQAVRDKNFYWFNRYRVTDGYSTYGGRAWLRFVGGQSNYEVAQRELEVLDVMTANRDQRVWAVAQGKELQVDDSNTPPFIPVVTNKPGPLPGGKHAFLSGQEEIGRMTVAKGMKVNLFASEKEFPELVNPVQMAWDPKGRLWVAVWPTYPHWQPKEEMNDKILILEDTDGDGKADKCTVFADKLHNPTGMALYNGGLLVAHTPDVLFLKDSDGDDKADQRVRVLSGIDSADTHHTANSFALDPGGAIYFQEGTFHQTQVETPYGPPVRSSNAGVFRYEPRTQKFELYVNYGFANPHGHVFDHWGNDFVTDGTGANTYHATLFNGQTDDYKQRHSRPPLAYKQKTRPCPGIEVLSSRHFPEANQGNLLVGNVIGFQGILQYKLKENGSSYAGTEVEPILSSTDLNFRPSDLRIGPDGAIYFLDWHNPIIGHMQHNLRDPSRDRTHGRIYRVIAEGRPLLKSPAIAGEPIAKLLTLLQEPEIRVRERVRIELSARDSAEVIAAAKKWVEGLDQKSPQYEHSLTEALWLHQAHNVVNEELLKRVLRSPDHRARTAATRVLCYWRDQVKEPLPQVVARINDANPRVRLEAIRTLSFFHGPAALTAALELLAHPDDEYLRHTFNETLATLERRLGSGAKFDRRNIAAGLLNMLEKIDPARKPALVETICRHGGAKELKAIWEQTLQPSVYSPALRRRTLESLADAALTRRTQPQIAKGAVQKLFADPALQADAIRLAAAWKLKDAAPALRKIARDSQARLDSRQAALDGLAVLGDAASIKELHELAATGQPLAVRFRAAIALAQLDVDAGAQAAAAALAGAVEDDDPSSVVEAFLMRKNGSDKLATALEKQKIAADTAKRILRSMYLAGRNDARLGNVVSRFAGIDASPKPPSPAEVKALQAEALAKGDAVRGEHVFRRADLGCQKCHGINKAGGAIGPDLGPIGGSSPVDYIITSILDPNASIKEEYLTKIITTNAGQIITGIVAGRDKNQVVLKDATGKLVRIALSDIDEEATGKTLMPEGVTRILTRGELLDLVRFISELGKPGRYAIPTIATVQRWKKLHVVPAALRDGIPNREAIRETVLRAGPEAWDIVFSRVDGRLPLDEVRRAGHPEVIYLQGDVQVVQAGAVEIRVEASEPVTFWVDEEPFEGQSKALVSLTPGRHRITVRLAASSAANSTLRVELVKPADSAINFEMPASGGD
jgi:putative heme-binding domain-containing protein